jgi:hypothetical protein
MGELKMMESISFECDFDSVQKLHSEILKDLELIQTSYASVKRRLNLESDGKKLKGNELVGWLGEIYAKLLFGGKLVSEKFDHDLELIGDLRISVKARKGKSWKVSSAIPKIEGQDLPTHLLFIRLNDDYSLASAWFFKWDELLKSRRFEKKFVRGQQRGWTFTVKSVDDKDNLLFPKPKA